MIDYIEQAKRLRYLDTADGRALDNYSHRVSRRIAGYRLQHAYGCLDDFDTYSTSNPRAYGLKGYWLHKSRRSNPTR